MPLRDHFRPPVSKKSSWEGFHAMWPTCIVQQLRNQLPPGFVAEPRVHLGTLMEIHVGTLELDTAPRAGASSGNGNGGTATAAWTATLPAVAVDTEPPDEYEYEVRIFDVERERRLVAIVEFVSPANKDRPESRDAFVAKCAALLRKGVAVSVGQKKDRHVGLGIFAKYVLSTGRLEDGFLKNEQGVAVERHEPSSSRCVDHRLAILVHQGSDPTPPYQALVIRESAMLFSGFTPWDIKGVLGSRA
jgi:hypothetical protein